MVKAIVLRTAGTNCDFETVHALEKAGFEVSLVHVNELVVRRAKLSDFRLLALPGGFSHGDYLGSGKVLANKMIGNLKEELQKFVEADNLVIGICNGFQVLVKTGLLPAFEGKHFEQNCSLAFNDSNRFQCEWVVLDNVNKGKCVFTKGVKELFLPIAHGEGKFVASKEVVEKLEEQDQVVFKYRKNPNGSVAGIAGICDSSGRILGLMPHPERNNNFLNDPRSTRTELGEKDNCMVVFRNAFEYLSKTI